MIIFKVAEISKMLWLSGQKNDRDNNKHSLYSFFSKSALKPSYSSKTSFVDLDELPTYGKNPKGEKQVEIWLSLDCIAPSKGG